MQRSTPGQKRNSKCIVTYTNSEKSIKFVRSYLDAISILLDFAPSTGEGKKIYNPLLSPLSVNPALIQSVG
jgi:hypothetical protein